MGCLMMLLGPIGAIIAGIQLLSVIQSMEQTAWALVYRETGEDQKTRVLITCRTDSPLHDAEAVYLAWLEQMGR